MNKDNSIKQCVLICEPISSDYDSASVFNKVGTTPVIDLCVNWLYDNGIKQIFLFYSKTKTQVQEYANHYSNSGKENATLHLNFMKPQKLNSFGDVLREVRFRNIIFQDFIILFADTVTNLDLSKAINNHFRKKNQLKTVVLTTVLRDNSFDNKIHLISPESGQILQMEQDTGSNFQINEQRINLKKINVQFRRDLTHCDIYICTMDVLKNFKDNQEYATMFEYINCVLTMEGSPDKIVGHILAKQEQCFRINRTKDYYLAYIHYISNHFYPNIVSHKSKFVHKNFNKVIFNEVSLPRSAYISNNCYVGQGCSLGLDIQIQKSILTSSCRVEKQSSIKNCIILQGCVIAEKSKFQNCLIEKVNQTQQIRSFNILSKYEAQIVTEPLFDQTPPPQQSTFEQNLRQILEDDPEIEIVRELNAIRYHHNKSLQQFCKQCIQIKSPGPKQVESFVKDWGEILLKIHDKQSLLISSLYYSCLNIPAYEKAFHVFLQYFYKQQLLKDFVIVEWFDEEIKKQGQFPALEKCKNFIEMLREQSNEQEDEQQNEEQKSSSNSQNSGEQ